MKFKINKRQQSLPRNLKTQSRGGQGGAVTLSAQRNPIHQIRENSLRKNNWNLFAGDGQYKTNFFLQFQNPYIKFLYDNHLVNSSIYSLRILMVVMGMADILLFGYDQCSIYGCFLWITLVLLLTMISLFATTKHSHELRMRMRKLIMNVIPAYLSIRSQGLYTMDSAKIVTALFFLPSFIMNLLVIADWLEYLVLSAGQVLVLALLNAIFSYNQEFSVRDFISQSGYILPFFVIVFSLFEKVKKEQFIVNFTNTKTRKILLQFFNTSPYAIAIVGKEGQIAFCNDQFENMLNDRLNVKALPNSVFKLTSHDESSVKLKQMVQDLTRAGNPLGQSHSQAGEKIKKVEIRLTKMLKRNLLAKQQEENKEVAPKEKKKDDISQKNIFEKYEMTLVNGETIMYKSQKAAILTFNVITEQKAKNQLLLVHSKLLSKFMNQFSKKLEQLHLQCQDEDRTKSLTEFLGTTYVALNHIQQIQHEFQEMSDAQKVKEDNFLLKEEVMYCLETLSVKCLSNAATLNLRTTDCLPEKIAGDLQQFRLALQSVAEFAMKYCGDGEIDIVVDCDGVTFDKKYIISFKITISKNPQFNEEPLLLLLKTENKNQTVNLDNQIMQNYVEFFELISNFGIGIVTFPTLVHNLQGEYSIKIVEGDSNDQEDKKKEQDQAHPSMAKGKIKINYFIPLSQAELQRKIMSPYMAINKTKKSSGSTHTWKSPLNYSRPMTQEKRDQINIMRTNMKALLSGPPPKSPDLGPSRMTNNPKQFNPFKTPLVERKSIPEEHVSGKQLVQQNLIQNQKSDLQKECGSLSLGQIVIPGGQVSHAVSQVQQSSAPAQKPFIPAFNISKTAQKIENELRQFEKKDQGRNVDFFNNKAMGDNPNRDSKISAQSFNNAGNQIPQVASFQFENRAVMQDDISFDNQKKVNSNNISQSGIKTPLFINTSNKQEESKQQLDSSLLRENLQQYRNANANAPAQEQRRLSGQRVASFGQGFVLNESPILRATDGMENFDSDMMSEEERQDPQLQQITNNMGGAEELKHDFLQDLPIKRNILGRKDPLYKHIPKEGIDTTVLGASKNLLTNQSVSPSPSLNGSRIQGPHQQKASPEGFSPQIDVQKPENQDSTDNAKLRHPNYLANIGPTLSPSEQKENTFTKGPGALHYQQKIKLQDESRRRELTLWDKNQSLIGSNSPSNKSQGRGDMRFVAAGHLKGARQHTSIDTSKSYVLVVEDNKFSLSWVTTLLNQMKVESVIAENGQEAVTMFTKYMREGVLFDLILMDLLMPQMNGYDATVEIRRLEEQFQLTSQEKHFICGFSAEVNPDIEAKCRRCGMDDIISKPISKIVLEDLLKQNKRDTNILGACSAQSPDRFVEDERNLTILPNSSSSPMQPQNQNSYQLRIQV